MIAKFGLDLRHSVAQPTGPLPFALKDKYSSPLDATVAAAAKVVDAFDPNGHKAGSNLLDKAKRALHGDDGSRSSVLLEGANSE